MVIAPKAEVLSELTSATDADLDDSRSAKDVVLFVSISVIFAAVASTMSSTPSRLQVLPKPLPCKSCPEMSWQS